MNKKKLIVTIIASVIIVTILAAIIIVTVDNKNKNREKKLSTTESNIKVMFEELNSSFSDISEYESLYSSSDYTPYITLESNFVDYKEEKIGVIQEILSKSSVSYDIESLESEYDVAVVNATIKLLDSEKILESIKSNIGNITKDISNIKEMSGKSKQLLNIIKKYYSESNEYTQIKGQIPLDGYNKKFDSSIDSFVYGTAIFDSGLKEIIRYINSEVGLSLIDENIFDTKYKSENSYNFSNGLGTSDSPAGLFKAVDTTYIWNKKKFSISVEITEILTGNAAREYANSKHNDNRGILDATSKELIVVRYKVYNLSERELSIKNKFAMASKNGNIFSSTGELYGLTENGKVAPDEYVELETYFFSDTISNRFLVYGNDFDKELPMAWFFINK